MFCNTLKRLRRLRGYTQEQLAKQLNISQQSIGKWENNKNMPDLGSLIELSRIFDVTTDYLLGIESRSNLPFSPEAAKLAGMYDELPIDAQRRAYRYIQGEYEDWNSTSVEKIMEKTGRLC